MKTEKQQQARNLYMHSDKTQVEIADLLDISTRSLYLWIKNGKWEQMKKDASQAQDIMLSKYYNYIQAINEKIEEREDKTPTLQEINMLSKLQKMIQFSPKYHTSLYMQSFEELLRFINIKDHELCKKVVPLADDFIQGAIIDQNHQWADEVKDNVRKVVQNQSQALETGLEKDI